VFNQKYSRTRTADKRSIRNLGNHVLGMVIVNSTPSLHQSSIIYSLL
jgi:hypothetical protein